MLETEDLITLITKLVIEEIKKLQEEQQVVSVGISARHVHLARKEINELFGEDYHLTPFKALSQPGQFAANETVELIGDEGSILKVRVLGPERPKTQIEISLSDARRLGLNPPVRASGAIENTPGITLKGPKGEVRLEEGVIIAERHLHLTASDALKFSLKDGDKVAVFVQGKKGGAMNGVTVRAGEGNATDLHIDTDDANAFGLSQGQKVRFQKIEE